MSEGHRGSGPGGSIDDRGHTRVVLQKEPPREDLQVEVKRAGDFTIVTLGGRIAETFKGEELGRRLVGNVILDTRQVDRVTSFGVRAWLAMLDAMDIDRLYFVRCSEPVLSQMSMIRSFVGSGEIISFFAPYLCDACGNAFQVLYEADEDRATIEAARPVVVPCPRCQTKCTLDDDPDSFFRIGPLHQTFSESLKQALGRLPPLGEDADPIEKSVRDDLTVVKFNTRLDASVRLRRVFDGLEGAARFELASIPEVTERGQTLFVRALRSMDPAIRKLDIYGCPAGLAEAVLAAPPDERIRILSVVVQARCNAPPSQRDVYVDLVETGRILSRGEEPTVPCDWCDHPIRYDRYMPLLRALVGRLGYVVVDPAPPEAPPPPEPEIVVVQEEKGVGLLAFGSLVLTGLLGVVGTLALVVGAALIYVIVNPPEEPEVGWVSGKTAPPEWTEVSWREGADGIVIVAGADAETVDQALEAARQKALWDVIEHLRDTLRDRPVHAYIPKRPPRADDPAWRAEVIEHYLEDVTGFGLPEREEVAVRKGGASQRIFVRYRLSAARWKRVQDHYGEVFSFRGMDLGRRFPTQPNTPEGDVLVVATRTWLAEPRAGVRLLAVGDRATLDLDTARSELESQWDALEPGTSLTLKVHDGKEELRVRLPEKPSP